MDSTHNEPNDFWIVDAGDALIEKKARDGVDSLSPMERLIYCIWVADYGMRNAGDLDAASEVYPQFQTEAAQLSQDLGLPVTYSAFSLPTADLQIQYFALFDRICHEIRRR